MPAVQRPMQTFHWLEKFDFDGHALVVQVAQLVRGEPDGAIGHPLEVTPDSARYRVHFPVVGAFKTVPELFNEVSETANKVDVFLFHEPDSAYAAEMQHAMALASDIPGGGVQHYVVHAENVVTHVLAASAPQVSRVPMDPDPRAGA